MPPAARISDMHTCPMVNPGTPPPPHVGGPVSGAGAPTVIVGGMPSATLGSICTCCGPPDSVVKGSSTVLFNNKPAARQGDNTSHGGVIVSGCPTVLIGEVGMGGPQAVTMSAAKKSGAAFCEECAMAEAAAIQNIQSHVSAVSAGTTIGTSAVTAVGDTLPPGIPIVGSALSAAGLGLVVAESAVRNQNLLRGDAADKAELGGRVAYSGGKNVASGKAGLVGVKAGAKGGALLGAKIGLLGGPKGVIAGAAIGAIVGAGVGYFAAKKGTEKAMDAAIGEDRAGRAAASTQRKMSGNSSKK